MIAAPLSFHPPVALVVGAGDATGSAIARRFARGGFTVVAVRRNADKLTTLVEQLQALGHTCHTKSVDVLLGFSCNPRDWVRKIRIYVFGGPPGEPRPYA